MGGGSSKQKKVVAKAPATRPQEQPGAALAAAEPSLFAMKLERWQAESRCDPGFGADDDDNQDVVMVDKIDEISAIVAAVFDGHGPSGREVAESCRAHLCDAIRKYAPKPEEGQGKCDWLEQCFHSLESHVAKEVSDDLAESGASGTILVYLHEHKLLYSANVGDSKAILGDGAPHPPPPHRRPFFRRRSAWATSPRSLPPSPARSVLLDYAHSTRREPSMCTSNAPTSLPVSPTESHTLPSASRTHCPPAATATAPVEPLTVDHLPSVVEERKRIVAAGGRVAASDDVQLGTLGELRVWKGEKGTVPGLTISRSIGDSVAKEARRAPSRRWPPPTPRRRLGALPWPPLHPVTRHAPSSSPSLELAPFSDSPGAPFLRAPPPSAPRQVGVIATPSTQRIDLGSGAAGGTKLIVLGSSGIWKVFSPKELIELLAKEKSVAAAADRAISEARNRWEELWQGENTSIVVLTLPI